MRKSRDLYYKVTDNNVMVVPISSIIPKRA